MTTYRPGGARIVAYGVGVVMMVVTAAIGVAMPDFVVWTGPQLVTLGLIGLGILTVLHGIGRSFVRVSDEGLTILNGYRRHEVDWTDIQAIVMKRGAPWPTALLKGADEKQIILFAIQGSDGAVARRAAEDLAKRVP
jgi:hypothetical protein